MKHDYADQEIDQLYQQRKQAIKAPNIVLNGESGVVGDTQTFAPSNSIGKMLMVLVLGSSASFGIFAIISHLAVAPSPSQPVTINTQDIEIEGIISPEKIKAPTIPVAPLPPKPSSKAQEKPVVLELKVTQPLLNTVNNGEHKLSTELALPELHVVAYELSPEFKVMPEYPTMAIRDKQSGSIKLSYRITEQGRVVDIHVEQTTVNHQLKQAAKQALSKWRYQENSQVVDRQAVVFEFNLNQQ